MRHRAGRRPSVVHRTGAAVLGLALVLSGCTLGPDYRRPELELPDAWSAADPNRKPAWPATDWWRGFASPQLDDFMDEARRANYDIGAAVARIREADAQARIAGAMLLPTVEATAGATRERRPSFGGVGSSTAGSPAANTGIGGGGGGSGGGSTFNFYTAALSASYEIDFWGKNRAGLEAAEAAARASRFDEATVALTTEASVATTYFQILSLQDRLEVARQNLTNARSVLEILQARVAVGTAAALDLAQQEGVVAGLEAAIPPLQQQLEQATHALAILIGRPPEHLDIPHDTLLGLSTPIVAPGLTSELLARRPDVQSAEAQLIAANANIRAARAAFFPSVDLTAQGGFESLALHSLFQPDSVLFSLAAGVTQPIFEGGSLEGQLEFSRARYDELVQSYRKAVIAAFQDVEDSLVATRQTAEQERLQGEVVRTARQAYDISTAQLRAGTIDLLTVLNTQTTLFSAQDTLVQVRLAQFQALAGLFKALGGGWS
jgi:NodT family efflux transporter outer membrane factor (OMF) lipoprotein